METFSALLAFVRGIHRPSVNSPHKGQWRGALMFSLIWVWINGWVKNCGAGDLGRHRAHHDVIVMVYACTAASEVASLSGLWFVHNKCSISMSERQDELLWSQECSGYKPYKHVYGELLLFQFCQCLHWCLLARPYPDDRCKCECRSKYKQNMEIYVDVARCI